MAISAPGKLGGKALTNALRTLSEEMISVTDDGTPLTRAQKLAEAIWKLALGHYAKEKDAEGRVKDVWHPPVAWAMQYCFERLEGKAPMAQVEEQQGIKAADKVRQLSVERLNKLAGAKAGPPKFAPKGK